MLRVVVAVVGALVLSWTALIVALALLRPDGATLAGAARLLPDLLRLLRRLAGDPATPRGARLTLWLLLAYLASPVDLVPDFVPVLGYADDAIVAALAVRRIVRLAGPEALDRHWTGTPEGLAVVRRLAGLPTLAGMDAEAPNRWLSEAGDRSATYDRRWEEAAAAGGNIHGEADLVERLGPSGPLSGVAGPSGPLSGVAGPSGPLSGVAAPTERLAHVHLRLARTAASACLWDMAEAHLARVTELADRSETFVAHTAAISAQLSFGRGDPERAVEAARTALAAAEVAGLHEVSCEALEVIGRAARLSDLDRAEAAFVRAHDIAVEHGLMVWRVRALFELGTVDLLALADQDRLVATRELALATGALAVAAQVDLHIAGWYAMRLDGRQVVEASRRCGDTARRFGLQKLLAVSLVFEADGWARLGREDEMEARLHDAFALRGDDPEVCAMAWAHVRARSSLISENRRRAVQELETAMSYFRRLSTAPAVTGRAYWALLRAVEDRDGEAACAEVRASGVTANLLIGGYLHLADAVLLGRAGQGARADQAFAVGDGMLASIEWHRQFGRRLVAEAAIADGWGDPATWMQQALPVFEDHQHGEIAAACRSLLRRAGAPVPRRRHAPGVPTGLRSLGVTARETEVLALLAQGLPNREIAERLYLSPRTVERHISNLTVKAGVRSRSELIAFAARA
jgi:DNA-binding CsgD family transcriptional regulator/uncharacterized membrane protein YkvA (DUF1232 family)